MKLITLALLSLFLTGCAGTFCAVAESKAVHDRIGAKLDALPEGPDKDKAIEAAYWADFLAEVKCASEVQAPAQ